MASTGENKNGFEPVQIGGCMRRGRSGLLGGQCQAEL